MRRVPFVYRPCVGDGSCAFCFVRRQTLPDGPDFVTGELRKESRACKNQKRRKTESPAVKRPMVATPPPPLPPAHSPSSESGISCTSSPTWSLEEGKNGNRRRISGESSSDDGRSCMLNAPSYNVYLPTGNCSPASSGSCGEAYQDSPMSEDMGSPSKLPRTEVTYATLTPAAVAENGGTFEMGSPIPAAVNSPMIETTHPILSNGCYTYDSLMQDDFPDLFVMHDGGEKRARAVPDADEGEKESASFELVTPEMLREFRRRQAEAELQFDSAQDEADHGVVARSVVTEKETSRESPEEKGVVGEQCEKIARGKGDIAKAKQNAKEEATASPTGGNSRGRSWMIPFSMGIAAALVAQLVLTALL